MNETEQEVREDTGVQPPEEQTASSGEGTDTDEQGVFLGRWKTKEAAEQGVLEQDRKISKQGEELAALKAQFESMKQSADMAKVITELAKAQETKKQDEFDVNSFAEQLAEEAQSDVGGAVKKLLKTTAGWTMQDRKAIESMIEKTVGDLKKEIHSLRDGQEKLTSDYIENKETVDRLVSDGMSLSKAKEWAKKMRASSGASQPERQTPPGSVGVGRVSTTQKKKSFFKDDAEWQEFKDANGLDDGDRKQIEDTFQRNLAESDREEK